MKKIILFGTGELLPFYENIVENLDYVVIGYSDNNREKWGKIINDKPVIPPLELGKYNSLIFISSAAELDISKQIKEMNLGERLILHKELEDEWIEKKFPKWEYLKDEVIDKLDKKTVVFDLLRGVGWAGTEVWSYKLAVGLKKAGEKVTLLRNKEHPYISEEVENMSIRVNYSELEYFKMTDEIVRYLVKCLPCVVINNFVEPMSAAIRIVKKYFPDMIKVITISHNCEENEMFKIAHRENLFDYIFCVSTKIKRTYIEKYNISSQKLLYKETPIDFIDNYKKALNNYKTLRIGYPSRLVIKQKRTDLLEEIIRLLEKEKIDYILNIAGSGTYEDELKSFIDKEKLKNKIKMRGLLSSEDMITFWESQDVYINMSEYEGTCQAMLEAMGYGVVPIVTNVSGVDDFIKHKENGLVSQVGDTKEFVANIKWAYDNKDKLKKMGEKARQEIISRCKLLDYVEFFKKVISNL